MRHAAAVLIAILFLSLAAPAQSRDSRVHFDVGAAIAAAEADGTLDGSVKFYFEGMATPAVLESLGAATTNRKTNALNKSDEEACRWVLMSALVALQEAAKARGANAVVGIVSNYKNKVYASPTKYECGAGGIMDGVALKGTYARVAAR
jgi:uncharacterized protein YbjQ (UPF0145 family)